MKNLLILLLILSCSKVEHKPVRGKEFSRYSLITLPEEFKNIRPEMDTMVVFLWPEEVKTNSQRKAIREVISSSRALHKEQEVYLDEKFRLQKLFHANDCDCILNGLCEEGREVEDTGKCYEVEEETYKNEERLVPIYNLVEKIENAVSKTNGDWFKTHLDYPELPASRIDLEKNELTFTNLIVNSEEAEPIGPLPFKLEERNGFIVLISEFPDPPHGSWKIEVTLNKRAGSVNFQGKIYYTNGSTKREGIIQWANPVKM